MNTIAIIRIVLLISIFCTMIMSLLFMIPGLYMWFPLILSMIHISASIVGLFGVLTALSSSSASSGSSFGIHQHNEAEKAWYCSIAHAGIVLVEIVLLFVSVIYWGASTSRQIRRWYTNGAIVLGIMLLLVDLVTFVASVLFIAFVRRAKYLPETVNSSSVDSGSVDL